MEGLASVTDCRPKRRHVLGRTYFPADATQIKDWPLTVKLLPQMMNSRMADDSTLDLHVLCT